MEKHRRTPFVEPPSPLTVETALLIAIPLEMLLYGVYTCLFFESLYIMQKKRKTRIFSGKVFLVTIVSMYIIATIDIGINILRLLKGYIVLRESVGPVLYLLDLRHWENIAHDIILCLMTWFGDALVIYRCFLIWNQSYYVIALPTMLLVLSIVVNGLVLRWLTHPFIVSFASLLHWMDTIYPVNFAQNVLTTGLIAFKIWCTHRTTSAAGVRCRGSNLKLIDVIRILVESAMLYTVQLLVIIVLYFRQHNAQFIVQYAIIPTIGIVFNLIAVRIHISNSRTLRATSNLTGLSDWSDEYSSARDDPPHLGASELETERTSGAGIKMKRVGIITVAEHSRRSKSLDTQRRTQHSFV